MARRPLRRDLAIKKAGFLGQKKDSCTFRHPWLDRDSVPVRHTRANSEGDVRDMSETVSSL